MNASILQDVVWAMGGADIALFIGLVAAAMRITHCDNRRNAALWAAYLAEHPELADPLGGAGSPAVVRTTAGRHVMAGRLPVNAGQPVIGAGVLAAVGGGGLIGGAEEQVHG